MLYALINFVYWLTFTFCIHLQPESDVSGYTQSLPTDYTLRQYSFALSLAAEMEFGLTYYAK